MKAHWQNNWLIVTKSVTVSHRISEGPLRASSQRTPFTTFWQVLKNNSWKLLIRDQLLLTVKLSSATKLFKVYFSHVNWHTSDMINFAFGYMLFLQWSQFMVCFEDVIPKVLFRNFTPNLICNEEDQHHFLTDSKSKSKTKNPILSNSFQT